VARTSLDGRFSNGLRAKRSSRRTEREQKPHSPSYSSNPRSGAGTIRISGKLSRGGTSTGRPIRCEPAVLSGLNRKDACPAGSAAFARNRSRRRSARRRPCSAARTPSPCCTRAAYRRRRNRPEACPGARVLTDRAFLLSHAVISGTSPRLLRSSWDSIVSAHLTADEIASGYSDLGTT
jgi:hypothetical protein